MKYKIFVDGQEGTTGLQINERLECRNDIEILKIEPTKRKDLDERHKLLNQADLVFLCLPDSAAIESVSLVENQNTRIIDASTAHRTDPNWSYGLPELSKEHRDAVKTAKRVSVPGCYATGFISAVYPLVKAGILPKDYPLTCHAVSGYSGGGKKAIEQYEVTEVSNPCFKAPRFYSFGLVHKHVPEMQKISDLNYPPIFSPIICNFYQGMTVAVPLVSRELNKQLGPKSIHEFLAEYYKDEHFIQVIPYSQDSYPENGFLAPLGCNHTNKLELYVFGNNDQILLLSRLDNLGKGSSGAAIQNMNIMLGLDESTGLE